MSKPRRQQARLDPNRGSRPPEMVDLVEPAWIFKALAWVFAVALLCAYTTVCVLFHYGQWQLVLHPSRAVVATPSAVGLSFTEIHFGVDASGQPQLDGWWIPGDSSSEPTVLMLHGGNGSMADALLPARALHQAGLQVLLFDYRGFGLSAGQHPTQALMQNDAESALTYVISQGHDYPGGLAVYGTGVGASLAVKLCADHSQIAALVLESPDGDFATRARADVRSKIVPVRLLFNQNFPLADPLHTLITPKLLITYTSGAAPTELERAADPKMTVELASQEENALHGALERFLSTYLYRPVSTLSPTR